MTPLIDFTNPLSVLTATALFVLVVLLARETKKSSLTAIMLVVFLLIISGHSAELSFANSNLVELRNTLATCITYDVVFIALSFFAYLWVDDMEAKEKKIKSLDNSLSWFWKKV